jgi:hypothetical protein
MAVKTPTVIPATTNAATNEEVVEALVSAPVADMMGDRYDATMIEGRISEWCERAGAGEGDMDLFASRMRVQ